MNSKKHIIQKNKTIKDALSKINTFDSGVALILFVIDENAKLIGSLTDGDIRRGFLNGATIEDKVSTVMQKNFKYIKNIDNYEKISGFKKLDLKIIPHITGDYHLIKFIDLTKLKAKIPLTAVIMAGGKGIRLKPYTNDMPKPMLELNGKPIIAHNIDRLLSFGIEHIFVSVNHMKEQIIDYINKTYKNLNIKFIEETEPLGTIGSVSLIDNFETEDILVMNSDILSNIDFYDFFTNYKNFKDNMSVATFNIRINVPYGILDTTEKRINSLIEKPSFTYYSNAGIYLINKQMLKYIPKGKKFDSTDLMEKLIEKRKKVSHFPIRGYWLDIGNAQNYAKAQDDVRFIKF